MKKLNLTIFNYNLWSIRTRFIVIALLPIMLLYLIFTLYSFIDENINNQIKLKNFGDEYSDILAIVIGNNFFSSDSIHVNRVIADFLKLTSVTCSVTVVDENKKQLFYQKRNDVKKCLNKKYIKNFNVDYFAAIKPKEHYEKKYGEIYLQLTDKIILAEQKYKLLKQAAFSALAMICAFFLSYKMDTLLNKSIYEINETIRVQNRILESKIKERTSELKIQRDWMTESNHVKTALINRLNTAIENERKHIARELHDELNSQLIAARLPIDASLMLAQSSKNGEDKKELINNLNLANDSLTKIHHVIRTMTKNLRPESLDLLGLKAAIETLVGQYNSLNSTCRFSCSIDGSIDTFDSARKLNIFRLIQESFSNVIKHANASSCNLSILKQSDKFIIIEITDNGVGFQNVKFPQGIGLIGMRERVESINGIIDFDSASGKGTCVKITLPLNESDTSLT
jgi:signal transduction histidine kinase